MPSLWRSFFSHRFRITRRLPTKQPFCLSKPAFFFVTSHRITRDFERPEKCPESQSSNASRPCRSRAEFVLRFRRDPGRRPRSRSVTVAICHGRDLSQSRSVTVAICHGRDLSRSRSVSVAICHGRDCFSVMPMAMSLRWINQSLRPMTNRMFHPYKMTGDLFILLRPLCTQDGIGQQKPRSSQLPIQDA